MRFPPPTEYRREVGLILRESASGRVVYETHAQHDGVWSDDLPVFAPGQLRPHAFPGAAPALAGAGWRPDTSQPGGLCTENDKTLV